MQDAENAGIEKREAGDVRWISEVQGMVYQDWDALKMEYVTTKTSYAKLAEKYGISISQIKIVAARDGWTKERKKFAADVQQKAYKKACSHEADRLARLIAATTGAIDVAMRAISDDEQFNRYLVERREKYVTPVLACEKDGGEDADVQLVTERQWTEERTYQKVDTRALKDLTGVLKDLTGLVRDLYGIPTQAQAEAQRIAAERLELDRKKAEEGSTDTHAELEIVGLPEEYRR